jgi:hypothetical protein
VRGQSGGDDAEAVDGVGDERAPVSDGAVLWFKAEAREVAAARRRSGEGKSWRGEEGIRPVGRQRRGGQWGSGDVGDTWRKRGTSRGVPADRRAVPSWQRPETGGRGRRAWCARGRPNR